MSFQLKDFKSILASMVNIVRSAKVGLTDFSVGSKTRTLLEAPASEIDQLYQEMFHGLKEAIPVATYRSFDFSLLPEIKSSGLLKFEAAVAPAANITIPAGTPVKAGATNVIYETAANAVLLAGQTSVTVLAVASVAGVSGNADADTITELQVSIPGITSVTNEAAFTNGRDVETEDERKVRFQGFIRSLARGVLGAIQYGAENAFLTDANGLITERAALVTLVEPYKTNPAGPIALVQGYIHNGVGSTSSNLVAEVQKVVDGYRKVDGTPVIGWKAAGVVFEAYAATEVVQAVTAELVIIEGFVAADIIAQAEVIVAEYLAGLGIGQQAIYHEIVERLMAIPGVFDVDVTTPAANTGITGTQKLMPGVITITEAV